MHFQSSKPVSLKDTNVFQPIKVGTVELKNRVAMAPMTRFRNVDFTPTPIMSTYYDQRSKAPGTLIITEGTIISPEYGSGPSTVPSIDKDEHVEAWKPIHEIIHKNGCFSFQQIWAWGRQANPAVLSRLGIKLLGPSDGVYKDEAARQASIDYNVPLHGLTKEEIKECIQHFVRAAENSLKAGADGVEIHGANGYLLNQFLDPVTNKRTDEYGGSIENRARFTLEVVDALIEAVGAEKVGLRLSPWGKYSLMTGYDDPSCFVHQSYVISELERRGREGKRLAYIHLVEPDEKDRHLMDALIANASNDFIYSIWNGVVIRCGDYIAHPERAKQHSAMGQTIIAYGKPFTSNPDLPQRLYHGWNITEYDGGTFYNTAPEGMADFPTYEEILKDGFNEGPVKAGAKRYDEAIKSQA